MARKFKEDDFTNLIKRLNELSNLSPEQERQELLEAAKKEPRILDDRQISLADIAKLAGIKEFKEPTKISSKAEKLIESITGEKSDITRAIEAADKKTDKKAIKEAKKKENRLDKIAELEAKLAELKAEQKEEQTYDAKTFREVVQKDVQEYIRSCDESALVELYNSISDNEAVYNEELSNILVKTEETKEIIADAEKLEQEVIAEKEKAVAEKEEGNDEQVDELTKRTVGGGLISQAKALAKKYAGDVTKAYAEIEKLEKGLSDNEEVQKALKQYNEETTDEATGFQGQSEARQFDVRLAGDFDRDRPTSDTEAMAVKTVLKNAGIQAEVQPSEANFSSVSINTMSPPEAVMSALGDMVDENLEYKDELSENKK